MKSKKFKAISIFSCLTLLVSLVAGCGSPATSSSDSAPEAGSTTVLDSPTPDEQTAGTEITVMVPPWAEPSAELLNSFTEETGIKVVMNIVGWDDIRNKVSIAAVGKTAPADVFEVDWSWTGKFGAADWFEPIVLTDEEKADMPTVTSFTYGDTVLALSYANDFPLAYYKMEISPRIQRLFRSWWITEPSRAEM